MMSAVSVGSYNFLKIIVDDGVVTVVMNRPEALNAQHMEMKTELSDVVRLLGRDHDVRAVVFTGEGKAFSAGGDVKEMVLNTDPATSRERLNILLHDVYLPLARLEKPTIAAVNGFAFGSGLSLALACDIVIAAENVKMSCAFIKMGLLPDCGSLYFLPRRLPMSVAKELVLTGRQFTSEEALNMGLVNRVVPRAELMDTVLSLARELATGPTLAIGLAKRLLDQSLETSPVQLAELESLGQAILLASADNLEARKAFEEKRPPIFRGR